MKPNIAERIAEYRKMLAAATPGPWIVSEDDDMWQLFGGNYGHMQILKAPKRGTDYAEYWPDKDEANLIVNSPEIISNLIGEVERLERHNRLWETLSSEQKMKLEIAQREVERQAEEITAMQKVIKGQGEEIDRLREENRRLKIANMLYRDDAENEKEDRPKFRMDTKGNLTRIEYDE
jgi:predicted RNase H-like nuclease (RuvC/YqgF family)